LNPLSSGRESANFQSRNRKVKLLAGRGIPQEHIRQLVRNPQTGKPVSVRTLERALATEIKTSKVELNSAEKLIVLTPDKTLARYPRRSPLRLYS
jgi:hypothetical protein